MSGAAAAVRELVREPAMGQAAAVDVHHRVPGAGTERAGDRLQHPRVQVGEVVAQTDPEHGEGPGHVDQLARGDHAGAQEARRLVAGAGHHRHARGQPAGRRRLPREVSHHLGGRDDPRHPGKAVGAQSRGFGQLRRPALVRGVIQSDPGEVGGIDEGLLRREARHPAGDVSRQGNHLGDAPVPFRRLLPPPQHARCHDRQVAAQLDQARSGAGRHLLLMRQVAAVQSRGVPRRQRLKPAIDAHGAAHLTVAGEPGHLRRFGPCAVHHRADAGRGRGGEPLRVLLRHARRRLAQRRGPGLGRDQVAVRVVQPRLDRAGPEIHADQILLRHAPLVLADTGTGKRGPALAACFVSYATTSSRLALKMYAVIVTLSSVRFA